MKKRSKFTDEMKLFVREYASPDRTVRDVWQTMCEKYNSSLTIWVVRKYMTQQGLPSYRRQPNELFTQDQEAYVRSVIPGRSAEEAAQVINEKYGMSLTAQQIAGWRKRHHAPSGRDTKWHKGQPCWSAGKTWDEIMPKESQERSRQTTFKKGNLPHNTKPVGTVSIRDRWKWIKVADNRDWHDWQQLHRYIWERDHGPIPKGMCIAFKDNDSLNCSPDNLILIDKKSVPVAHFKLGLTDDVEINEAVYTVAQLRQLIRELENA